MTLLYEMFVLHRMSIKRSEIQGIVIVLLVTVVLVQASYFGKTVTSDYRCHCENDDPCDANTGACPGDCDIEWMGPGCQYRNMAPYTWANHSTNNMNPKIASHATDKVFTYCSATNTTVFEYQYWRIWTAIDDIHLMSELMLYIHPSLLAGLSDFQIATTLGGHTDFDFTDTCYLHTGAVISTTLDVMCDPAVYATHVYIKAGVPYESIGFCEVKLNGGREAAFMKTCVQSGTPSSCTAMNDGDISTCTMIVDNDQHPYWEVDLGIVLMVESVYVHGNTIGVLANIKGFRVLIRSTTIQPYIVVYEEIVGSVMDDYLPTIVLIHSGQVGRYVLLTNEMPTPATGFQLCEVTVYVDCAYNSFGKNCTKPCGNCLGGAPCDLLTGECPNGCAGGEMAPYCQASPTVAPPTPGSVTPEIHCTYNCYSLHNPQEMVEFYVNCTDCVSPIATYKWATRACNATSEYTCTYHKWLLPWLSTSENFALAYYTIESWPHPFHRVFVTITMDDGAVGESSLQVKFSQLPPVGVCSVMPTVGETLYTHFNVTCSGFELAPWSLHYILSASKDEEFHEGMTVYHGDSPNPTGIQMGAGEESTGYKQYLKMRVSIDNGAATSVVMEITVNPFVQTDSAASSTILDNLEEEFFSNTSDVSIDSMLESGDIEHATNILGVLASSLATIKVQNTSDTNSSQKLMKKKQVMTTSVVNSLKKMNETTSTNEIKSLVYVLNQATQETEELAEETEEVAVDVYSSLAENLNKQSSYHDNSTELTGIVTSILEGTGKILDDWTDKTVDALYNKSEAEQPDEESKHAIQEKSKASSYKVLHTVDNLFESVKKVSVENTTTVMKSATMTASVEQIIPEQLASALLWINGSDALHFTLPSNMPEMSSNVFVKMLMMEKNPYVWDETAELVTSPILSIGVDVTNISEVDVDNLEPVAFSFPIKDSSVDAIVDQLPVSLQKNTTDNSSSPTHAMTISFLEYNITVAPGLTTAIDLEVFNITNSFAVIKTEKKLPTIDDIANSSVTFPTPTPSSRKKRSVVINATLGDVNTEGTIFLSASNVTTTYYISVVINMNDTQTQDEVEKLDTGCVLGADNETCLSNVSISVQMSTKTMQCLYWDDVAQKFSGDGCQVASTSTSTSLDCECKMEALFTAMTSFTSSVFVLPHFVDPFGDAVLFLSFFDNPVVVTVVVMVWVVYFFIIHWSRQADRRDLEKVGVIPCRDNNPAHRHGYVVTVNTGWWKDAGTTANVFICIQGSKGQTSCRSLNTPTRLLFQTGSDDSFLVMTEKSLGDLEAVTLWHDNTGDSPHWYLNDVIIRDLRQDQIWTFIYLDWLSLERGSILRTKATIEAVTEEDLKFKNKYNFITKSSRDFRDTHLWISIFSKPARSTFTRVQRVTCGLFLLLTTMLTNIMFYGIPTDNPDDQAQSGGIQISLTAIMIGIESSLLMFPLNMLVMQMFQNLRQKPQFNDMLKHRRQRQYFERVSEAGQAVSRQIMQIVTHGRQRKSRLIRSNSSLSLPSLSSVESSTSSHDVRKPKSKCLPWWCLYIAWVLVMFLSLVTSYLVMLYGLKLGYNISVSWLVSFFTGFTQGALITQPLKIVAMAVLITLVCKKAVEFDDYGPEEGLDNDEQYLHAMCDVADAHKPTMEPLSRSLIAQIKQRLRIEWLMNITLRDIGLYVIYTTILLTMVYGDRNIDAANMSAVALEDTFSFTERPEGFLSLEDVRTVDDIRDYLGTVVSPALSEMILADDDEARESNYFLLGTYRLRQQRIVNDTCSPWIKVLRKKYFVDYPDCVGPYEMSDEDTGNYNNTWSQPITDPVTEPTPWTFQSSWKLKTIPYSGIHATYSGGGYVLEVVRDGDVKLESEAMVDLLNTDWIDDRTRSLYLEFTVYNPSADLFSVIMIVFEFTNSGGIFAHYEIFTARLYQFSNTVGTFIIVSRYLFVVFNLAFAYYEIKRARKLGRKEYFSDSWSFIEILQILLSFVVVGLFIQRLVSVTMAMDAYRESDANTYVSFYPAIISDFILGYAMGFLVGLVTIKAAKLIRFHRATFLISDTISFSKSSLASFAFMVSVYSIGFAHFTLICFGAKTYDFRTFIDSLLRVLCFTLGEIDYDAINEANSVLGGIYYVVFIVGGIWVMLTFFVIILNLGIFRARLKAKEQKNQFELFEYIQSRIKLMF